MPRLVKMEVCVWFKGINPNVPVRPDSQDSFVKLILMNVPADLAIMVALALIFHKVTDVYAHQVCLFFLFSIFSVSVIFLCKNCTNHMFSFFFTFILFFCTDILYQNLNLGYNGMQCQIEQSECRNGSCPERAMCQDLPGPGSINCLCRSGYEGSSCNITVNPCTSADNPCLNGATCMPLQQGRYKCVCPPGLTGPTCSINIGNDIF